MTAADVVEAVRISDVWRALGGPPLRRGRGRAWWRDGQHQNVSVDAHKGVWIDYASGAGGGILDLIVTVRGGTREDALRWVADLAGISLTDSPATAEERADWARERAAHARDLTEARYWLRAAVKIIEDDLAAQKAKLFDPMQGPADGRLIDGYESLLRRVRDVGDLTLVTEFLAWRQSVPKMTAALVGWARARQATEVRALMEYMRQVDDEVAA